MKEKEKFGETSSYQPHLNVGTERWQSQLAKRNRTYTCTFCFQTFPSAQSLGGHQNVHRAARKEEKRLRIRDVISHRKRLYLQSQGLVLPPPQPDGGEGPSALHENQNNSNSLPLDLNLRPTEINDLTSPHKEKETISDVEMAEASNKSYDDNDMGECDALDLNLKL